MTNGRLRDSIGHIFASSSQSIIMVMLYKYV